jgi:glycosyltransferase involved in cell wall biosynthesis
VQFYSPAIKKCKKLITVSASLKKHLLSRGLSSGNIACIPNGVMTPGPLVLRPEPSGKWCLGVIALFRPRKGIAVLLKALAILKKKQYPFILRAVGQFETSEYEYKIKTLVRQMNLDSHIEWTGFKQDINIELKKMDVFILSSLFGEGTPMVILEAMAAGVPVIATKVEGIPEVITNKKMGIVVEAGNEFQIARVLESLFKGNVDWSGIRNSAYQQQCIQYSDVRMAKDVALVYDNIIVQGKDK